MSDLLARFSDWLHMVFVAQIDLWVILGFIAQALFMMRFVVQWIASERAKQSVVPVAFWFFSLGGGFLLLVYAVKRADPVFIAGQGLGLLIYLRNLVLIFRHDPAATPEKDKG
ncbi:lipid-A-disaccharide synthase [Hartmannibacter diazotrophicus]|uniref:Lipid-A-disaccharide synthase n=1 Tax=Hartmannibacter diazotrophicus TaxID=1482074 RepID=A0A2C9D730_9HYPH|nr:lipid-A-disaccharide synthase N-terminal domain-containing protein [Hartmannibacter diazotrophicus]SON55561.1 lipid-A-disaccharide synthase [Hartmannibacter diazotrophicus]